jgi:hypothetical protein
MKSTKLLAVPRYFAALAIASALALPVWAQQAQSSAADSQSTPSSAAQQASDQSTALQPLAPAKEGFWGRVNPFARKKWVKKQTDPINDRLSELDQVNARNASEIKDVDARAQAGIKKAQDSADAAGQVASSANQMAMNANNTAQQTSTHVDKLNSTVGGLDQYSQISNLDIEFRGASPALTTDARAKLDQFAAGLAGRQGYIIEMDAQSPAAGSVGIQNSQRLAEAVERYLVTAHQISIYRMHSVALGNATAPAAGDQSQGQRPDRVRTGTVHLRLMENSLAAPSGASPQNASAAAGAEQP